MRQTLIVAGLGLLLALGACAGKQQTSRDGMAPSRAASQKPLDDSQYYAPSEKDDPAKPIAKTEPDNVPAAYVTPEPQGKQPAVVHVPVEAANPGETAKPLVPAFPAKMEQQRLRDMQTVFFAYDQADLSAEAKRMLETNAAWLKANPGVRVKVEGHCDERGTSEYNLGLGARRANQVRDYLIHLGVSAYLLETVSFGEEMPLKSGHDEGAWKQNRRVQFSLAETPRPASAQAAPKTNAKL